MYYIINPSSMSCDSFGHLYIKCDDDDDLIISCNIKNGALTEITDNIVLLIFIILFWKIRINMVIMVFM